MLFLAPLLAGAAGAPMRLLVVRTQPASPLVVSLIIGLVAGGIATVLFVTAQLTADPALATGANAADYARRTIPWAVAVGFIAGFTSDAVFGKLVSQDVLQVSGVRPGQQGTCAKRWHGREWQPGSDRPHRIAPRGPDCPLLASPHAAPAPGSGCRVGMVRSKITKCRLPSVSDDFAPDASLELPPGQGLRLDVLMDHLVERQDRPTEPTANACSQKARRGWHITLQRLSWANGT